VTITIADIDTFLSLPKTIFAAPTWVEDGNRAVLRADLVHQGTVLGGVCVNLSANIHTVPQRGDAVLIYDGKAVQRLAFMPKNAHPNPRAHPAPVDLRLRMLPPDQSRIYRWRDNRAWPPPQQMAGVVIDSQPSGYSEAVDVFLLACGVDGSVPAPPWRPALL
jgi:hypothetical protein